jgi:hypothetical protein
MDPQNFPQQQPIAPNPYDYLNTSPQRRASFGGGDPKKKLIMSVAFVAIVLLVVGIGLSIILSLGKKDYTPFKNALYTQNEIIRIADAATTKARTPTTRQFVATILYATSTEKAQTQEILKKGGVKITDKQLAAKKNADNDKALETAEQANRYDEKVTEVLNTLLLQYSKDIKEAKAIASTKTEKELIATLQKNILIIAGTTKTE